MKKYFLSFVGVILVAIFFIASCSKNTNVTEPKGLKDPSLLSEDQAFVNLTIEAYEFITFLSKNFKEKSLIVSDIQQKISDMQSQNLGFDVQYAVLDDIFKGSISERLKQHLKELANWSIIKEKYTAISEKMLQEECSEILYNKLGNNNPNLTGRVNSCGWRYYLCSGAATAGAIVCHSSCAATLLAIPACVAACATIQVWAITECNIRFCSSE